MKYNMYTMTIATTTIALLFIIGNANGISIETMSPCKAHTDCNMKSGETCYFSHAEASGFCFSEIAESAEPGTIAKTATTAKTTTTKKRKSGPTMKRGGIVVQGEEGQAAVLSVKSGKTGYRVGAFGTPARFAIQQTGGDKTDILTIKPNGDVTMKSKLLRTTSIEAESRLLVNKVPQWSIVKQENYVTDPTTQTVKGAEGWKSVPAIVGKNAVQVQVSRCGGLTLLGGVSNFDQAGSVAKIFKVPVAATTKEVRITARFHFIDMWLGQSGYLKIAMPQENGEYGKGQVVWSSQYETAPDGLSPMVEMMNVCGNPKVGEHKFSVPIDIVVPLKGRSAASAAEKVEIKLEFGSTWAVPADENGSNEGSWGISGVEFWQH